MTPWNLELKVKIRNKHYCFIGKPLYYYEGTPIDDCGDYTNDEAPDGDEEVKKIKDEPKIWKITLYYSCLTWSL